MEGGREVSPLGRVSISNEAVAQIVGYTIAECYGVVGMAARGGPVGRLLTRGPTQGVEVSRTPQGLAVAVHVVVEHGLNLAEVAAAVRSRVAYEVERTTGLRVASVAVDVADVRGAT